MQDWPTVLKGAVLLLVHGDRWVGEVAAHSLRVSLLATACGALVGLPLAGALAAAGPRLRRIVVPLVRVAALLPAVLVGLLVALLLSPRNGGTGAWRLGTPLAVGVGQSVLALLVVTALAEPVLREVRTRLLKTVWTLGAAPDHAWLLLAGEARMGLAAAVVAGFARVVGEAGSALILGGGSATLAAAVVTQAEQQAWTRALALGMTLTALAVLAGVLWVRLRDDGC